MGIRPDPAIEMDEDPDLAGIHIEIGILKVKVK